MQNSRTENFRGGPLFTSPRVDGIRLHSRRKSSKHLLVNGPDSWKENRLVGRMAWTKGIHFKRCQSIKVSHSLQISSSHSLNNGSLFKFLICACVIRMAGMFWLFKRFFGWLHCFASSFLGYMSNCIYTMSMQAGLDWMKVFAGFPRLLLPRVVPAGSVLIKMKAIGLKCKTFRAQHWRYLFTLTVHVLSRMSKSVLWDFYHSMHRIKQNIIGKSSW